MQLLHVFGFINRVVYNAREAYADQLRVGESYAKLADVVAISICDFTLWRTRTRTRREVDQMLADCLANLGGSRSRPVMARGAAPAV